MLSGIKKYRLFVFINLAVVVLVIGTFRVIPDKAWASVLASFWFISSTAFILWKEWTTERRWTPTLIAGLLFTVGSLIPVTIVRILSWGGSFEATMLGPVSGAQLHRVSNALYLVFLVGIFIGLQQARLAEMKKAQINDPSPHENN